MHRRAVQLNRVWEEGENTLCGSSYASLFGDYCLQTLGGGGSRSSLTGGCPAWVMDAGGILITIGVKGTDTVVEVPSADRPLGGTILRDIKAWDQQCSIRVRRIRISGHAHRSLLKCTMAKPRIMEA